jgi:hypothetical protein
MHATQAPLRDGARGIIFQAGRRSVSAQTGRGVGLAFSLRAEFQPVKEESRGRRPSVALTLFGFPPLGSANSNTATDAPAPRFHRSDRSSSMPSRSTVVSATLRLSPLCHGSRRAGSHVLNRRPSRPKERCDNQTVRMSKTPVKAQEGENGARSKGGSSGRRSDQSQPSIQALSQHHPQQHERQREDGLAEGEEAVVRIERQAVNCSFVRYEESLRNIGLTVVDRHVGGCPH